MPLICQARLVAHIFKCKAHNSLHLMVVVAGACIRKMSKNRNLFRQKWCFLYKTSTSPLQKKCGSVQVSRTLFLARQTGTEFIQVIELKPQAKHRVTSSCYFFVLKSGLFLKSFCFNQKKYQAFPLSKKFSSDCTPVAQKRGDLQQFSLSARFCCQHGYICQSFHFVMRSISFWRAREKHVKEAGIIRAVRNKKHIEFKKTSITWWRQIYGVHVAL